MKHVALIGADGYVGSALYKALQKVPSLHVQPIVRKNYLHYKKKSYDVVINAAMPSSRFWAEKNPEKDFIETVKKTADIVYGWKYKKLIQISSISARSERKTVYGRHKALAEALCHFGENLIVRLTATYSDTLKKGALIDILKGQHVFVSKKSRYSFAGLDFACQEIVKNIDKKGIREIGAKDSISLEEIVADLGVSASFIGRLDIQEVQKPLPTYPSAKDVLVFMRKMKTYA